MSTEENKDVARRYVEQVLNGGNLGALDHLASPNYRRYVSPTAPPLNLEAQKQRLAGLRAAFPDIHLTIDDMIAEGDRIGLRMTLRGTHRGALLGVAPTGKTVTAFAFDVVRIENGKLIEHWGGPDLLNILQQLGAAISAAPEKK